MGLYIFQCEDCRLLHHITEVAGKREFRTLSLGERRLNEQNLSANTRPSQTCDHTGIVVALIDIPIKWRFSEQVFNLSRRYFLIAIVIFQLTLVGNLTQRLIDLLLQLSNATLTGVSLNNHLYGGLVECWFHTSSLQAGILQFAWYEMTLGYLVLLLSDITAHLDDFHTVEQWPGDC